MLTPSVQLDATVQEFDLVLRSGTVIDGSRDAVSLVADVGIVDDRIGAI